MGHETKYKKTIDGYLLDVCESLGLDHLPKRYYKICTIEQALQLSIAAKKEKKVFLTLCHEYGLPDPEKPE